MVRNLETKAPEKKAYAPEGEEEQVRAYLKQRIPVLKDSKKNVLLGLNFEDIMKEADREYQPEFLSSKAKGTGRHIYVQDETQGLRGARLMEVSGKEGQEWRSDLSEPTLFVKIQTALSILIDQNPEAVFKATVGKYKATSAIAQAMWKRSWSLAQSKNQLKLFIFDVAKYGFGIGRTYPRKVQFDGEILVELDYDKPENNKYEETSVIEFNDVFRQKCDPYRTWIDDMTNLTDPWSMDDWYYEKDFSRDAFLQEFGMYENHDKVSYGKLRGDSEEAEAGNEETKTRDDIITVGFYESRRKDLYAMHIEKDDVVLYYSPLPNDEKKLSCWWSYWNIRDPRTPYGIGLYEILKHDKVMYDRLDNMDLDQLTLAVYTLLFYSGSNQMTGSGDIHIQPGVMKQKLPGTTIDQVKIDYNGKGREGAEKKMQRIDENTGITPTLQGAVEGKTLGEVLHAKDAALKRLNVPLSNIAHTLENEAMISLSWMNQVYSIPEVKDFTDIDALEKFQEETGTEALNVMAHESGAVTGDFYPVLDLSLEEDRDGNLIESPEARFFKVGHDTKESGLPIANLKWQGKITINVMSMIAPSQELDRQRKLELFNMVTPIVGQIATMMMQGMLSVAMALAKPVVQILEIQDEKPENWLPIEVVEALNNPVAAKQAEEQAMQEQQEAAAAEAEAAKPLMIDPNNPEAAAAAPAGGAPMPPVGTAPSAAAPTAESIVPRNEVSNPLRKTLGEISKVQ